MRSMRPGTTGGAPSSFCAKGKPASQGLLKFCHGFCCSMPPKLSPVALKSKPVSWTEKETSMKTSPSYEQVNARILKFRDDRDWKQFHTIQSLITSLAIEAGELLELTQWKDTDACRKLADSEDLRDECADVLLY
jgi:hypothetical protein